jgi:hypothetical protein
MTYEAAIVLTTVTSQVALRPSRHGIKVKPSGRSQSDLARPCGYYYCYYELLIILLDDRRDSANEISLK